MFNIIELLNLISFILGLAATLIGVTQKDTWKDNNRPTRIGWLVIILSLLTFITQIGVKTIEKQKANALAQAYAISYKGWISVGQFNGTEWKNESRNKYEKPPYLMGLERSAKIDTVKKDGYFLISNEYSYAHENKPTNCDEFNRTWIHEGENNTKSITALFYKNQLIKILDVYTIADCDQPGTTRVFAKVIDARAD
ncbi:MAG: hypothetical protein VKL42_12400 [Snowella sp.]|nr:hypothetical protein [Snowella sp.]